MACFWTGILNALNTATLNTFIHKPYNDPKPQPFEFVNILKSHNVKTHSVLWNGMELSEKELEENFDHIKNYDPKNINDGYDCSTCEPFLLLVAQLFNVNITHNYNGNIIKYRIKNNQGIHELKVRSNRGHFWHGN